MDTLGPEDQPDAISVGPVHDIPIIHDDDPRYEDERAAWSRAKRSRRACIRPTSSSAAFSPRIGWCDTKASTA